MSATMLAAYMRREERKKGLCWQNKTKTSSNKKLLFIRKLALSG